MNYILNVSGKTFEVQKEVLMKMEYFKSMITDCDDQNRTIFVPRSQHIFNHVLSYVIDRSYPYPKKYEFELKFYGITYNKLYDKNEEIIATINNTYDKMYMINDDIKYQLIKIKDSNNEINKELEKIKDSTKCLKYDSDEPTKICRSCNDVCVDDSLYCNAHFSCIGCYDYPRDRSNYCDAHIENGQYCSKGGCDNDRVHDSKFCKEHDGYGKFCRKTY